MNCSKLKESTISEIIVFKNKITCILKTAFALLMLLVCSQVSFAQSEKIGDLDSFVEAKMQQWEVPGLALGIVKEGDIIYQKEFGIQQLNGQDSVGAKTRFAIGSLTKSFTAAALAMLVEEGLINWDDPVIEHLPQFRSKKPWLTHHITISDLLSHQTGFESSNVLFWRSDLNRAQLVQRFQYLEQRHSFRKQFLYNNLGYVIAGNILAAKTDLGWDSFVQKNIFEPTPISPFQQK